MAKTKICNTCEKRFALDGFPKNPGYHDGRTNKCRDCTKAYVASRKGKGGAPIKVRMKVARASLEVEEVADPATDAKIEAAIAEEPAPLLAPAPLADPLLDVIPALGCLVFVQTGVVDGRVDRHAIVLPRTELRSFMDRLARLI